MPTPQITPCADCPAQRPFRGQSLLSPPPSNLDSQVRGTTNRRAILWAYFLYLLWQVATKLILGVIYFAIISEGLRMLLPTLGTKIHKLPGLSTLYEYELTHRLDLAHPLSILVLTFVWMQWSSILRMWLGEDGSFDHLGWQPQRHTQLIVGLGAVLLISDAALFYVALAELSWNGSWFSATALLATAAYLAVLIFVTLVSINLHRKILLLQALDH